MKKRLGRPAKDETEPEIYMPHEEFRGYMLKLLQTHKLKERLQDPKLAGEKRRELQIEYEKKYNQVHHMKDYYLQNIVFPAMANLLFFFEAVSNNPNLFTEFEDQIKDLLGIRRLNPRAFNYATSFISLIEGMIVTTSKNEDFRVRLMQKLGDLIWLKVTNMKILETPKTTGRVLQDIGLGLAWLEMLASRVSDEYDLSLLSPRYGTYKTEEEADTDMKRIQKKTLEDFEKHARENSPSRTFNFNTEQLLEPEQST